MRHAPVVILAVLATACLGPRPWWEKELAAWEGASVSELMDAWGPPNRTVTGDDGQPVLVYDSTVAMDRRQDIMVDPDKALGRDAPDQGRDFIQDLDCSMYFEIENEVVAATRYEGAGCQVVSRKNSGR
ncbi:MAG: hypothetical protein P8080_12315 [Gammaproteobacteria bacterium]